MGKCLLLASILLLSGCATARPGLIVGTVVGVAAAIAAGQSSDPRCQIGVSVTPHVGSDIPTTTTVCR